MIRLTIEIAAVVAILAGWYMLFGLPSALIVGGAMFLLGSFLSD